MDANVPDDLSSLALPELLAFSQALVRELSDRVSAPGLLDDLPRFHCGPEVDHSAEWGVYTGDQATRDTDAQKDETVAEGAAPADRDNVAPRGDDAVPSARASSAPGNGRTPVEPPQGSLPEIQHGVEVLARTVEVARTALAGHTAHLFDVHELRAELLGIPVGKSAFRDARDYLRLHLQLDRREVQNRLDRAAQVMGSRTLDGVEELPPRMPVVADAVRQAAIGPSAADLLVGTLESARKEAVLAEAPTEVVDGLLADGERLLMAQARDVDTGTLQKICKHWRQRFDAVVSPDGAEPTEAQLNAAQGLFYRGAAGAGGGASLHRWTLMATDAQHEILMTVAAAAANPRARQKNCSTTDPGVRPDDDSSMPGTIPLFTDGDGSPDDGPERGLDAGTDAGPVAGIDIGTDDAAGGSWAGHAEAADAIDETDGRTPAQRELDGLVSALTGALALADSTVLPDSGGSRPQVMVTIDYASLLAQTVDAGQTQHLVSSASFTGPISPTTVRQWACDAEVIPVVLGGESEVLDIGRSQRLFTRKLRRAIMARDGGCAAPGCWIPAPWCEVHHIEYWEEGGPTSVDNGALLCSHHHHAVHAGAWEVSVRSGVPWFIPAPCIDPRQRPRRNRYWRPGNLDSGEAA